MGIVISGNKNLKFIKAVYYQPVMPPPEYLTIEALEDSLTVKLSTNSCEYSLDGNTWSDLPTNTNTSAINKGQKLYFKGNLTPTSSAGIGTFTISKKCNVSGNIMSLLFGDNFEGQADLTGYNYAFYKLFYNCKTIIDASKLIIPATTLVGSCYDSMFRGCSSLVTAPELPATTLVFSCYSSMFSGCSKLNYIKALFITKPGSLYTNNWVYGVSSTGAFIKNKNATWNVTSISGIPTGWNVKNDGEEILITFYIDNIEYQAIEGMTWEEWVNSEYNVDEFWCDGNYYVRPNGRSTAIVNINSIAENPSFAICDGCAYHTLGVGNSGGS